jgi:hypothetical protein
MMMPAIDITPLACAKMPLAIDMIVPAIDIAPLACAKMP